MSQQRTADVSSERRPKICLRPDSSYLAAARNTVSKTGLAGGQHKISSFGALPSREQEDIGVVGRQTRIVRLSIKSVLNFSVWKFFKNRLFVPIFALLLWVLPYLWGVSIAL